MPAQLDREYVLTRPLKGLSRLVSWALYEGRPLTTRGRWINPLVFGLLRRHAQRPRTVDRPIFIVGLGRSGTTVLGKVMSMHRDVGFLNEPKAIWHLIHPGEDIIGNYTEQPARYRLSEVDATPAMRARAHAMFGGYLAATRATRLVDKYPELVFRADFVRALFPDAKFLVLLRNGWNSARSIESWSTTLGRNDDGNVEDWWGLNDRKWHLLVDEVAATHADLRPHLDELRALTAHSDRAVLEWTLVAREALALIESGSALHVRYEALADADPAAELARIFDYCELRPDDRVVSYGRRTLHGAPPKNRFDLNPLLRPSFEAAMNRLGYAL